MGSNEEKATKTKPEVSFDVEPANDGAGQPLARQLKNRHVAMISIGGVIGTGLFLGTATSLKNGGPIGLLLGYLTLGTICWSVMVSLGEMVAYLPIAGGHIKLAERFVDRALSFAMGWNYWYNWAIFMPTELSAASIIVQYWNKDVNIAVWITIGLVLVITINMMGAGAYGEAEFIFASIKIITITGLIILGIVLDLGGGPNHDRIGFRYWKNPGPFVNYDEIAGNTGKFLGWWSVMSQAAFAFVGTEIVAIAAGEAKNPRRNLPKAIRRVYIRILLFYIGVGTTIIGLLVPSNDERLDLSDGTAASSPFVIAIKNAGIGGLPSVINAALLTSAWSAASSDLYTSSRALYGLAVAGNAPKIFMRTTRTGLPYVSVIFCSLFGSLAYMASSSGAGDVFNWFVNMTSVAGLLTWLGICITYIRFYSGLKAQGYDRSKLPFTAKFQPIPAWYGLIASFIICFFSGWSVFLKGHWAQDTFVTNYFPLMLFPVMYLGAKYYYKQPVVRSKDMDFVTNIDEIEADTYDEPPPKNKIEAFWQWLVSHLMSLLPMKRFLIRSMKM
ncbi:amino acid permease [Armillaria gallica]|uniref:Amino acid permease n=1 Tax=Armillaria gallica TaxID=47427 RepID=A0A2H3E7D2_ARMGA|nr:amino acid permease [Armillaria gallica]